MKPLPELRSFWPQGHAEEPPLHLQGRGGCADLIRSMNWEHTPLGPTHLWDGALVSTLNLMLGARFPMFLIWGPEWRLFYNDAYQSALSGKTHCMGRPFQSVFPEAWAQTGPLLQRAWAGESFYLEDYHVPLERDGLLSDTWWSFSYSPILSEAGTAAGVLGIVHETTRRILTEQALWSSEAALRSVTDKAPALMWRCAPDGRIEWVNQRLEDYAAISVLSETNWVDLVHPEDRAEARVIHDASLKSGRPFEAQQRLLGADRAYRWHLVRAQQMLDETGDLVGWCGSAVDIDDWRAAAGAISDRDTRFHEISTASTSLIWSADVATRRVEGLNPRFRSAWALPSDGAPVIWEDWLATLHPEDRAKMAGVFDRVAAGETIQREFRAASPAGEPRCFHATAFPILDTNGAVRRIGGLMVEVSRGHDFRVYLVGADDDALARGLGDDGYKIRRFDGVPALLNVIDDLLPGVVVIGKAARLADIIDGAPTLKANAQRLPWMVIGPLEIQLGEVVHLMKHGAANVLAEDAPIEVVQSAVQAVQPTPEGVAHRAPSAEARQRVAQLSMRERQVLEGLAAGGTNKTIALKLQLSPRTVETYRAQLMDRLGVRTLAELLRIAAEAETPRPSV